MSALDRLTPGQRKAVFALSVAVLTLFVLTSFATARSDRRGGSSPAPVTTAPLVGAPTSGAPPTVPPALDPDALAEAKRVATAFIERYASYRYDEDPRARADALRPFVTPALAGQLAPGSGATAARQRMVDAREVATATVEAVQTLASRTGAVELLVIVRQDVERSGQREQRRPTYEVVLEASPSRWAVGSVST